MSNQNDDLEALIKAALSEGEGRPLTEIERFISEHEILPSDTKKIPCYAIYDLYTKWTKEPLNKEEFFKQFSKHFQRTKLGRPNEWRGYWLLCDKIELGQYDKWLDYEFHRKKNQKRFKKITYKASRTRPVSK